jgi:hypothetical protein
MTSRPDDFSPVRSANAISGTGIALALVVMVVLGPVACVKPVQGVAEVPPQSPWECVHGI